MENKFMRVYDFHGENTQIVFDSLKHLDFTNSLSIEFLIYIKEWPNSWVNIIEKKTNDIENEFCFRIKNKNLAHWYYGHGNEVVILAIDIQSYLKLNQWNKIILVRDNLKHLKIYVNGKIAEIKSIDSMSKPNKSSSPLKIMCVSGNQSKIGIKLAKLEILFEENENTRENKKFQLNKDLGLLSSMEGVLINNDNLFDEFFLIRNLGDKSLEKADQFLVDSLLRRGLIDSIELIDFGFFGNSVKQILNCMIFAEYYKVKKVYIPNSWFLKNKKIIFPNGIEVITKDENTVFEGSKVLSSNFFHMSNYFYLFDINDFNYYKAYLDFKELMIFQEENWKINALDDNELVVYFRSGDIFHKPHPAYGQPPLSFYKQVMQSSRWRKVYCVFQDKSNPVVQPFIDYVNSLDIDLEEVSGILQDDISLLIRARNLVAAPGTFTWSIALISENLSNVYYFYKIQRINFNELRLNEIKFRDRSGEYVRTIMSKNWENSLFQRNLMLVYPEDEIVLNE